jgi:glutaredoxin
MDYEKPALSGYTIYSKSGCILCNKVKDLLKVRGNEFVVVDCDEYLIEDRDGFVAFMKSYAIKETGGFPKVFHNGVFIGGFAETKKYMETNLTFDENADF